MTDKDMGFSEILDVPGLGHNAGPTGLTPHGDELEAEVTRLHGALFKRAADLIAAGKRMPDAITDHAGDERATEFVKQIQACVAALDAARIGSKQPYDLAADQIHALFRQSMDELARPSGNKNALDGLKERVQAKQTAFKLEVERKKRAAAEEEARLAREREAAERAKREAAEAEARRLKAEADEAAAAAARKRNAETKEAAEAEARRIAKEAEDAAAIADAAREAERESGNQRALAETKATLPAADHTRARGRSGGVSSLVTFWNFRDIDRVALDYAALGPHFTTAAIEAAVRSYMTANRDAVEKGHALKGVTFFKDHTTRGA